MNLRSYSIELEGANEWERVFEMSNKERGMQGDLCTGRSRKIMKRGGEGSVRVTVGDIKDFKGNLKRTKRRHTGGEERATKGSK